MSTLGNNGPALDSSLVSFIHDKINVTGNLSKSIVNPGTPSAAVALTVSDKWSGAAKFVSTQKPQITDGADGDIWLEVEL